MNRGQLIAAMEEHARETLAKLESYREIEREYKLAVKALRALQGQSNGTGRPKALDKVNQSNTARAKPKRKAQGGIRDSVYLALKAHPKGLTIAEIVHETGIDAQAAHNALRPLKSQIEKAGVKRGPTGQPSRIYRLKT